MDPYRRHQIIWGCAYGLLHRWVCRKFNCTHEDLELEGPVLLVPNHVTAWDPLLVAMSLRKKQVYYVASEHIFRLGPVSGLLNWMLAPIPRRKASSGVDTVKACLRHLRAGHSVCLFAEGEQCWAGENSPIFPATGKLAKSSGATLVTYRLEGGYLSCPRWGRGIRRGKVHGHPVGIYPPERLKAMSPEEINEQIRQDIRESAWERQMQDPTAYRGKNPAKGMEHALYLCPRCRKIGTLQTENDRIFCGCGLELHYTETGFFSPSEPFAHLGQWDAWQREELRNTRFVPQSSSMLFSDAGMQLWRLQGGHSSELLLEGELSLQNEALTIGKYRFPMREIGNMALVLANRLLFTFQDEYYEILAKNRANFRKYLELWKEN